MASWERDRDRDRFSDIIQAASQEPQLIYSQDRLVAAVVGGSLLQEFFLWKEREGRSSIADAFVELRQLMAEENYSLEIPNRQDRPNPFIDGDDDVPL